MVESIYHVHEYFKAHGDETVASSWIEAGRVVLESLEKTRVTCGYASVKNVETTELEDNMPSFFLSETLKYLYLLFDSDENPFSSSSVIPSNKKKVSCFRQKPIFLTSKQGNKLILRTQTIKQTYIRRKKRI